MALLGTCLEVSGLLINGVLDLRTKQISLWVTVVYAAGGIWWKIFCGTLSWSLFFSFIPGAVCLMTAWITGEKVGYGDGFLLLAVGCYLGWQNILTLCMAAIICAGICALILCVFFHKGKNFEIPFVPFLLVGYVIARWFS